MGSGSWGRFCSAICASCAFTPKRRQYPFTLRRGQTVEDVARLVHKDVVRTLRYARVWGKSGFDGQQVGREHPVEDGDIVELHT